MTGARTFDAIVVGLGAMGSAAAYHLARRGRRVLGLDRFAPPHDLGSSHGQTRIIREAYFEHPDYVPLVQRSYALWGELERESGQRLLQQTGGLMIGPPEGVLVAGARRSAEQHGLPFEVCSDTEVRRRFPALRPAPDMVAILEPRAGILFPEACIAAHLGLAERHGAVLHTGERVTGWQADAGRVSVTTDAGVYAAGRLILAAGAWMAGLLDELPLPISVERQVVYWFDPARNGAVFSPARCPIHLWEFEPGRFFYGFPDVGEGIKVALHHGGDTTFPDDVVRQVGEFRDRGRARDPAPSCPGRGRSAAGGRDVSVHEHA
jgi:sarcosine oxidase